MSNVNLINLNFLGGFDIIILIFLKSRGTIIKIGISVYLLL